MHRAEPQPTPPRLPASPRPSTAPPRPRRPQAAPGPQPLAEAKPANGPLAEAHGGRDGEARRRRWRRSPPATKPAPAADAAQARTLEQVIGELLEPVIRQWLETNLPRMVEEVVREEVARAIAAERSTPKV